MCQTEDSAIKQFVDYRRALNELRNKLKSCLYYKHTSFGFMHEGEKFLVLMDLEHEYCNRRIGELTE